jgi:hypothetical protein
MEQRVNEVLSPLLARFLHGFLRNLEDGSEMFLQSVG